MAVSRVRARRQLMDSLAETALLTTAIEQAGESVVVTGLDGAIVYANPATAVTTGYPARGDRGRTVAPLRQRTARADASGARWRTPWRRVPAGGASSSTATGRASCTRRTPPSRPSGTGTDRHRLRVGPAQHQPRAQARGRPRPAPQRPRVGGRGHVRRAGGRHHRGHGGVLLRRGDTRSRTSTSPVCCSSSRTTRSSPSGSPGAPTSTGRSGSR